MHFLLLFRILKIGSSLKAATASVTKENRALYFHVILSLLLQGAILGDYNNICTDGGAPG